MNYLSRLLYDYFKYLMAKSKNILQQKNYRAKVAFSGNFHLSWALPPSLDISWCILGFCCRA
jgi:hypothetical protein